jgi:hypothetical protein
MPKSFWSDWTNWGPVVSAEKSKYELFLTSTVQVVSAEDWTCIIPLPISDYLWYKYNEWKKQNNPLLVNFSIFTWMSILEKNILLFLFLMDLGLIQSCEIVINCEASILKLLIAAFWISYFCDSNARNYTDPLMFYFPLMDAKRPYLNYWLLLSEFHIFVILMQRVTRIHWCFFFPLMDAKRPYLNYWLLLSEFHIFVILMQRVTRIHWCFFSFNGRESSILKLPIAFFTNFILFSDSKLKWIFPTFPRSSPVSFHSLKINHCHHLRG